MAPVVHGIESEYCDQVNFVYLDIDDPDNSSSKLALGYVYQPHIFLLDPQGNIITQWVGYTTGEQIEAAIAAALSQ